MPCWKGLLLSRSANAYRLANTPQLANGPATTATEGVEYTFTPALTGGKEPFTFAVTINTPEDHTFNTSTGAFAWTPASPGIRPGLKITWTDAIGRTGSVTWDIEVAGAPGTISPGAGWAGATVFGSPLPDELHGDSGAPEYANRVKANWIDPPFLEYDSTFNLGVVAFQAPTATEHAAGIKNAVDYVLMSIDGGDWVQIDEMTLEPDRGVVCYWLTADAAEFADGQHEARFMAVPHTGKALLAQGDVSRDAWWSSQFFWTNYNGTLATATRHVSGTGSDSNDGLTEATAMRSIGAATNALRTAMPSNIVGGGVVLCHEGVYTCRDGNFTNSRLCGERWLTVTRAPGVAVEDVKIGGLHDSVLYECVEPRVEFMRFKEVTWGYMLLPASTSVMKAVLFENVKAVGPGPLATGPSPTYNNLDLCPAEPSRFEIGVYHIGGEYSKWPELFNDVQFVRGSIDAPVLAKALVGESSFGGDIIAGVCRVIINLEVERDANWGGYEHPDLWQITGNSASTYGNIIGYGITQRGPYPGMIKSNATWFSIALVDVIMEGMTDWPMDFRGTGVTDMFLLRWQVDGYQAPLMGAGYTRCKMVDSHIDLMSLTPPTGWTYLGVT